MRIFGHKREEVTADKGKIYNEEARNFYPLPHIVRMTE
jgi:hypothetical protein